LTSFTLSAMDRWLYSDQLPNLQALNPFTQTGDPGREFMSHNDGICNYRIPDTAFRIVMYVRTTYAH